MRAVRQQRFEEPVVVYDTSEFRRGLAIMHNGHPYTISWFQHHKPGKGGAMVRTKLKSILDGRVVEYVFRAGEKLDAPDLGYKSMQFLYRDEEKNCHFMDTQTYEQLFIDPETLGDDSSYLQENLNVRVGFYEGRPFGVELPVAVELLVTHTEPGFRGDTATGATKPATLETGLVVQVPLFISEGEKLKIDTRTGEYIERVK